MFEFYNGKSVLVTGNTGFKGSWLCRALVLCGARVTGYALVPDESPSLFELSEIKNNIKCVFGDVRDYSSLKNLFDTEKPEIVFHLAAQPIVLEGYKNPLYTYETNVIGTANILECVRNSECVRSVLNVTTDKVYKNSERQNGYSEEECLDGYDPYSNSKSCSELVTACYKRSYFDELGVAVSTARAGNVIGGGDFAKNRIVPDCIRAFLGNGNITLRNPNSVRPYQHVLEPIFAYMMIAECQCKRKELSGNYNVGPDDSDCVTTGELVNIFNKYCKNALNVCSNDSGGPHEAGLLKLDCSKLKGAFNWKPVWNIERAIEKTVDWLNVYQNNLSTAELMDSQIKSYFYEQKGLNV